MILRRTGEGRRSWREGFLLIISLYIASFPLGLLAILFSWQASRAEGRGERTIWLASSLGLLWSVFMIFLVIFYSVL